MICDNDLIGDLGFASVQGQDGVHNIAGFRVILSRFCYCGQGLDYREQNMAIYGGLELCQEPVAKILMSLIGRSIALHHSNEYNALDLRISRPALKILLQNMVSISSDRSNKTVVRHPDWKGALFV